ncbi:hypothetical protein [Lacunimicrobium album]
MYRQICSLLIATALCVTGFPSSAQAAVGVVTRTGADLDLMIATDWIGGQEGGYHPVRIRVSNRGPATTLQFVADKGVGRDPAPRVTTTVQLDQNAKSQVTLNIPIVDASQSYTLSVRRNGTLLPAFSLPFTIPSLQDGNPCPKMLIIHPSQIEWTPFGVAAESFNVAQQAGSLIPHTGSPMNDALVVEPRLLPTSWQGYSGVDFVAIAMETLSKLAVDERKPLVDWVHAGGQLLVFNIGKKPSESRELTDALSLMTLAEGEAGWRDVRLTLPKNFQLDENATAFSRFPGSGVVETTSPGNAPPGPGEKWNYRKTTLQERDVMLGTVYAFEGNCFDGTYNDWIGFLQHVPRENLKAFTRAGVSSNRAADDFLTFLIPSIRSVPIVAFMFLITIFSIVIGPLNYLYFLRRRQLAMMLVSVPTIALVASVSLVLYSTIAHGFGVKSRIRSVTYLDQTAQKAVTKSRVSFFAGLTPSGGLNFRPATSVLPVWLMDDEFTTGDIDWSENQRWYAGWLKSRTRTQFVTIEPHDERGRLVINQPTDTTMNVSNGFEFDLRMVIIPGRDQEFFIVENLKAGDKTQARRLSEMKTDPDFKITDITNGLLDPYPMEIPATVDENAVNVGQIFGSRRRYYTHSYGDAAEQPKAQYKDSQLEKIAIDWKTSLTSGNVPEVSGAAEAATYIAVVDRPVYADTGLARSKSEASSHLIIGVYQPD